MAKAKTTFDCISCIISTPFVVFCPFQITKASLENETNGKEKTVCSVEISVGEDERGDEGPQIQAETQPAGTHLHPQGRHAGLHGLGGGVRSVRDKCIVQWETSSSIFPHKYTSSIMSEVVFI